MAAGAALLAACLAGTVLYVSATASAAVTDQLATACPASVGLTLTVPPAAVDEVRAAATNTPVSRAPVVSRHANVQYLVEGGDATPRPMVMYQRDGMGVAVTPQLPELGVGQIAVPASAVTLAGFAIGTHLTATGRQPFRRGSTSGSGEPRTVELTVVATFQDIPIEPEPAFWCDLKDLLRPTPAGDARPPVVLSSAETMAQLGPVVLDEVALPTITAAVTRREAGGALARYAVLERLASTQSPDDLARAFRPHEGLTTVVARADALSSAVARTIAPVRIAGALAAVGVLVAAGAMAARERRRELRLAALRGARPTVMAGWVAPGAVTAVVIGTVVGGLVAVAGVRWLGPSTRVERPALVRALWHAVAGGAAAVVVVVVAVVVVAGRFVDVRPRRRWIRFVPFELGAVALAVVSWRRLRDVGGVRMFGVSSRGGDLLAQSFPLVAVVAVIAVVGRLVGLAARLLRRSGRRLPAPLRLGWRRALADPGSVVAVVASVAVAAGCATLSLVLAHTADSELHDKALLFVGSDLAVHVDQPGVVPPSLVDRATVVGRHPGRIGSAAVDVVGVDRETFARATPELTALPSDELRRLLALLAAPPDASGNVAAVVVRGDVTAPTLRIDGDFGHGSISVRVVARPAVFPGYRSGTTMVVVDRAALLASGLASSDRLLVREPPPDALAAIAQVDTHRTSVQHADQVFDAVTFSAERWAYAAMGAFAALIALVAVTMQLLVVEARRDERRAADVLLRRSGTTTLDTWLAAAVELLVPVVVGVAVGVGAAWAVGHWSVGSLDPLPNLLPRAEVIVPLAGIAVTVLVALIAVAALATASVWSTRRAAPMEVMRSAAG
jgi:hypothetical protein